MMTEPEYMQYETFMWVVAHPDDLEFSSAGTVIKLARAGKRCILIQVTSGDRGTGDRSFTPETLKATREAEVMESAKRMGLAEVVFLHEGDGHVMPDIALREKIVKQIRIHKPDVIITHDPFRPYAMHPDHRGVGLATHDSVYPTARDHLYFPEHLEAGIEPHKTAEIWYFGSEVPDVFVDITDTFEGKIDALRAHVSQVGTRDDLYDRLRERHVELAKDQPFELAEAFKSVKMQR
ncbi:MAG TPA: PIG-L deacetylase family protein [Thermomicrobiales bacterium]|jgi:LmbE family N-acetylglucosaminyl deacetylase|nr:PIG-L deacetylase family protein [Thermomicrobiales bacterium]